MIQPIRWCVYCGSAPGKDARFVAYARELGVAFAERGIELVYGGGRVGLMGALATACMRAGGHAIGIIPHALEEREIADHAISDLRVVDSMHERKALMAELSVGFIALPGGFGTFEEICEAITWVQLGIQDKPCIIANLDGFYDPLIALFDSSHAAGFISAESRRLVTVVHSIDELLAEIDAQRAA